MSMSGASREQLRCPFLDAPPGESPIPPELAVMLREHIDLFGTGPGWQAVPQRERQPQPAVHLVAVLAEGPQSLPWVRMRWRTG